VMRDHPSPSISPWTAPPRTRPSAKSPRSVTAKSSTCGPADLGLGRCRIHRLRRLTDLVCMLPSRKSSSTSVASRPLHRALPSTSPLTPPSWTAARLSGDGEPRIAMMPGSRLMSWSATSRPARLPALSNPPRRRRRRRHLRPRRRPTAEMASTPVGAGPSHGIFVQDTDAVNPLVPAVGQERHGHAQVAKHNRPMVVFTESPTRSSSCWPARSCQRNFFAPQCSGPSPHRPRADPALRRPQRIVPPTLLAIPASPRPAALPSPRSPPHSATATRPPTRLTPSSKSPAL
jgi:hypothetical protein